MLQVERLSKRYGDRLALDAISFHIAAVETVGLLGPNGAGKTTAIAMISGIARPDGGQVSLGGVRVTQDANVLKRRVGLVPQDLALSRDTTPYNGYAHSFAGMTVQFILFAGIDAGILLLLTRQRGIWQRLRSAPQPADRSLAPTLFLACDSPVNPYLGGYWEGESPRLRRTSRGIELLFQVPVLFRFPNLSDVRRAYLHLTSQSIDPGLHGLRRYV
jgi:ABC-type oligopeptide transport system ATPase subunit